MRAVGRDFESQGMTPDIGTLYMIRSVFRKSKARISDPNGKYAIFTQLLEFHTTLSRQFPGIKAKSPS